MRTIVAAACALALLAATHRLAIARFANTAASLVPGSRFPARLSDGALPNRVAVIGSGAIENGAYVVPPGAPPGSATLVAANAASLAVRTFHIVAPPHAPVIAVASYQNGIAFHDPRTFAPLGTLATAGSPSDVIAAGGEIAATDTDGSAMTSVRLRPWSVREIPGILLGDELAADPPLHAFFVTERELNGKGGLARVSGDRVATVVTGTTAEGIAIDVRTQRVYVADVNDDAVAIVDAKRMRVVGRIRHVPRAFSLALSRDGRRLYVVSNQSESTFLAAAGRVTEIALGPGGPRVAARSSPLEFPVGIALGTLGRVFVTDEQSNVVDVLNARTLRVAHAPVGTCRTPWAPTLDVRSHRLYIPCAGSNEVDVLDARTLKRVRGAPFQTGGYPLAVSVVRR
ncbi:MAG: YncE family protein [Candidatus Tyrphobacter sp.]